MKNGILFRKFSQMFLASALLMGSTPLLAKSHEVQTLIPAEELKWVPNPKRPDDVSMSVVWGDIQKGKHGVFMKFKPGTKVENHSHSATLQGVVIQGTLVTGPENAPKKLGPGSFFKGPANSPHITNCESKEECIIYIHASGKFDLHMIKKAGK